VDRRLRDALDAPAIPLGTAAFWVGSLKALDGRGPLCEGFVPFEGTGAIAGTTLTWGACAPAPTMMNSWSFARARAVSGAGCATGYTGWGTINCTAGCTFVPAAGVGDSYQTWNQALRAFTFSGTNYATATFTMVGMQIPNGTGQSTTLLTITGSTVLATRCGSTPGTDLVCNVQ
jgi:hypothetical protein